MLLQPKTEKKNRFKTLILENCLLFGQHPKFTNKKITKYLFGTRKEFELFRVRELEHILLKIYPFVYTLLKNAQKILKFDRHKWQKDKRKPLKLLRIAKRTLPNLHFLFATNTDLYHNITKSAAAFCQMTSYNNNNNSLQNINDTFVSKKNTKTKKLDRQTASLMETFTKKYLKTKLTNSSIKQRYAVKKPTLVIIPDVNKSMNLIKEMHSLGIPILGLIDSSVDYPIDYPVFGNANSIHVVHFFCHLLAQLILKAVNQTQGVNVLPNFFIKTKENTKNMPTIKKEKYRFYNASSKYPMAQPKPLVYNPKEETWPRYLLHSFLTLKKAKFWARKSNLKFMELKHEKIRIILKVMQQFTEKQFLSTFQKVSPALRNTYFIFFNRQQSLIKTQKNLLSKKTYTQVKASNTIFHMYRAKQSSAITKLWNIWDSEQWQEQTYAGINNRYYWRRPRFYRELPWFFLRDLSLQYQEKTPIVKTHRKKFEHKRRMAKYKSKKNRQKKETIEKIKILDPIYTKISITQKIKRLSRKNRIKTITQRLTQWITKKRYKIKKLNIN